MVACSERQRLRGLLAEAIIMLCKTSLKYEVGFSIEGLLGITIDNSQVLLINIQEEVRNKSLSLDNSGKVSPGAINNSPIDLRTTSHHRPCSDGGTRSPPVTDQSSVTQSQTRVDTDGGDFKPDISVDYSVPGHRNGISSTGSSNSQRGMKQRRFMTQKSHVGKREFSPPSNRCQRYTASVQTTASAIKTNNIDYADDVIFIKEEGDSEGSMDTFPESQSAPLSHERPQTRKLTPLSAISPETVANPVDNKSDELVIVKSEDDSSREGMESNEHNAAAREASPCEATYEAGTWGENRAKSHKRRAKRSVNHSNSAESSEHMEVVSTKKPKKNRVLVPEQETPQDQERVVEVPVASDLPAGVDQTSSLDQATSTDQPERTDGPGEELETSPQVNTQQLEGDQTEWPPDVPRRPRASYSTAYKLMIVRKALESGNMRATARRFGIHFKQVWQWTRNKEKLLAMSLSALRSPRLCPQLEETENPRGGGTVSTSAANKANGPSTSDT